MDACGITLPDDLPSLGSPYVTRQYAGNAARRHIVTHRALRVVESLGLADGRVLDVGCGPGFSSVLMARRVARVTALDIDPVKIRIARRLAEVNHVELDLVLCDASARLPFGDGHFDGLISLELVEHIRDWKGLVAEMCRVVRPGGRLAVSTPGRNGLAQVVKTLALRSGLWAETTYEWFIPRREMIGELERHGVRTLPPGHTVLTAPMLPDTLLPLARGVERIVERTPAVRRFCSTTIYRGEKRS